MLIMYVVDRKPTLNKVFYVLCLMSHDDNKVDNFYQQLIAQTSKKDILVVQGDWNANGSDSQADWEDVCGPYCTAETNERVSDSSNFNL